MGSKLLFGAASLLIGLAGASGGARYYVAPLAPAGPLGAAYAAPGSAYAGQGAGGLVLGQWEQQRPVPSASSGSMIPYVGVAAVAMAAVFGSRATSGRVARRPIVPRMMFGGGGGGDKGDDKAGFLDQLKKAQEMFSPEMMQKYSQVGVKLEQVRTELAETEVACELEEGVTVVFSGTQAPMSVTVSEELCAAGPDAVSAAISKAMKEAHARSGKYAAEQMQGVYAELGINPAAMQQGMQGGP